MVTVTKLEGGRAMMHGQMTDFRETWIFEDDKLGTARIYIRVEECSEEQRKKNRERLDAAVREMYKSVLISRERKRREAEAGKDPPEKERIS